MSPTLAVVADNRPEPAAARGETLSERVRRLQDEARGLARDHVRALEEKLEELERMSAEIADGGEAYPVGVREIARRLQEDAEVRNQALQAIMARN